MTYIDPPPPVVEREPPHAWIGKAAVALVAGVAIVIALVAAPPTPSETLLSAREQRAVCQVQASTAVTEAQRTRAATCIADMDRVIAALTVTEPPPVPPPAPPDPGDKVWPNAANTGTPVGWVPKTTRTTTLTVTTPGAVVEDVRIVGASLVVDADNVTVRRVDIQGGGINNTPRSVCRNGLILDQVTIRRSPGQVTGSLGQAAVREGGYTARRVKIDGLPEAFRVGGLGGYRCGPVTVEDSFARVTYPDTCGDWHGDGIQGYDGPALIARNVTLELVERSGCGGTAPFFYPHSQGNTSVIIDRMLVKGGGFPFRLGMSGTVVGLKIVDRSWGYGPIDVRCSALSRWEAQIVTIDPATYTVTGIVREQPCNTEAGR